MKRSDYGFRIQIPTRWMDNDVYGHVNNVVYYAYFDTVINRYLIEQGGLDIHGSDVIGLCVESQCKYIAPVAFPDLLEGALRVAKIGTSSLVYEVGIFREDREEACAFGHFVHVFVERTNRTKAPLPAGIREAATKILRREES